MAGVARVNSLCWNLVKTLLRGLDEEDAFIRVGARFKWIHPSMFVVCLV